MSLSADFTGTRVLVTGSGAGIGLCIAQHFSNAGASVFICDIDTEVLNLALRENPNICGGSVCDVTKEADIEQLFRAMEDCKGMDGQLHVLVSNAGTGGPTSGVESITYDDWDSCVGVNLHGAFLLCRRGVQVMRRTKEVSDASTLVPENVTSPIAKRPKHAPKSAGGFCILTTSSTAGFLGYPNRTPYASAKWGLIGLTKSLAMELGGDGIRCNAICPGAMNNARMDGIIKREAAATGVSEDMIRMTYVKQTALKTFINEEDIARQAMFLASEWGNKITGQVIAVDGMCDTLRSA